MAQLLQLSGQTFGKLTVLGRISGFPGRKVRWACSCQCGQFKSAYTFSLTGGFTHNCGCTPQSESADVVRAASHPLYSTWRGMWRRCSVPTTKQWKDYGGRGITVDPRWRNFSVFVDDMGERPSGSTLDRIDNGKGYSPTNCRWATRKEQQANRRQKLNFTKDGRTLPLKEWSKEIGVPYSTLHRRIKLGWPVERLLSP